MPDTRGEGLYPGYSASGQDVWLSRVFAPFEGPGIVVSAVGARCGKAFLANGRWGVVANTAVLIPRANFNSRYLWYLLNDESFWEKGGSAQPYIQFQASLQLLVSNPPFVAQRAIADYLDRETAQIDILIAKQQQLIATLRERRTAVIADDLRTQRVAGSLKDKLGRHARIGNGSTPRREQAEFWSNTGLPWLNSSVVNRPRVNGSDQFVTTEALAQYHLPVVPIGSILIGLTGQGKTRGMATILDIEATVSQHVAYVTADPAHWDPEYLLCVLRANYDGLRTISEQNGSTKGGLTCGALQGFRLWAPELSTQRETAARVAAKTQAIDALISKSERFIALTKERRAALITAAVTGEIRIPRS